MRIKRPLSRLVAHATKDIVIIFDKLKVIKKYGVTNCSRKNKSTNNKNGRKGNSR